MAGGGGLEPPLPGPEPGVLPLDEPPAALAVVRAAAAECQGKARAELARGYCSECFSERLGLKRGTRHAGILMALPVRGLRPLRSARRLTRKVPKPPIVTLRPRRRESKTPSSRALIAFSAETLEPPDALAMAATRSALIMGPLYYARARSEVKRSPARPRGAGPAG